jgi:hypothetical protein
MADDSPISNKSPTAGMQFSLRLLFLITLVTAVSAATWGGLTRPGPDRCLFIFFGAAAPFGVLVLIGILHWWLRRRG